MDTDNNSPRKNGIVRFKIKVDYFALGINRTGNTDVSFVLHVYDTTKLRTVGDLFLLIHNKTIMVYMDDEVADRMQREKYTRSTNVYGAPPQNGIIKIDDSITTAVRTHDLMTVGFTSTYPTMRGLEFGSIWVYGEEWHRIKDIPLTQNQSMIPCNGEEREVFFY